MDIRMLLRPYHPIRILLVLHLLLWFSSCGGPKTHAVKLGPHPVGKLRQSAQLTIGVLPFEDDRPSPQVLGQRVRSDGKKEKILLQSPSPSEDVTYLLRRSLKARGVKVREISRWEPAPANLKDLPQEVDVAIAGRIKTNCRELPR